MTSARLAPGLAGGGAGRGPPLGARRGVRRVLDGRREAATRDARRHHVAKIKPAVQHLCKENGYRWEEINAGDLRVHLTGTG